MRPFPAAYELEQQSESWSVQTTSTRISDQKSRNFVRAETRSSLATVPIMC